MGAASRARDELRERVLAGEITPMQAAELAPRWGRLREPDGLCHDVPATAAEQTASPATGSGLPGQRDGWAAAASQATWWPVNADVLADAVDQARPFTGDTTADDRAWSARVDAAVTGMDALDPTALDQWMATHASSSNPHLEEAGLVAAFETWLANEYTAEATDQTDDQADDRGDGAAGAVSEQVATDDTAVAGDRSADLDDDGWP